MLQGKKKIKIPATNNKILVYTCSLIQSALFQEILASNHKILVIWVLIHETVHTLLVKTPAMSLQCMIKVLVSYI